MRFPIVAVVFLALAQPVGAESAPVVVTPLLSATTNAAGQPIRLPADNAQVIVSNYEIAPGAKLPVHRHPYPRYAYVLSGTLAVTESRSGRVTEYRAGQFIIEMVDAWHFGENIGGEPVRLLVIDQVEQGQPNTILRPE